MQKVWMVWREVDFNQEWLEGVFVNEALALSCKMELFSEWLKDRNLTMTGFVNRDLDDPFSVTSVVVQGSETQ